MIIVIVGGVVILAIAIFCIYMYLSFFLPLRKKEEGFKYVFVEKDGSVRELNKDEEDYLNEKFQPTDSARPYIKYRYDKRSPNGEISGFIPRRRIPRNIPITKMNSTNESERSDSSGSNMDNTRLFALIEQYITDKKNESYKKVVMELESGNSYLLLPSEHTLGEEFSSWTPSHPGLRINLGIWFRDGLKTTAAFTSEKALFEWAKKSIKYVSFSSQTVLELCKSNDIKRVIIDSSLRTMIVLQKND